MGQCYSEHKVCVFHGDVGKALESFSTDFTKKVTTISRYTLELADGYKVCVSHNTGSPNWYNTILSVSGPEIEGAASILQDLDRKVGFYARESPPEVKAMYGNIHGAIRQVWESLRT